MKTKLKTLPKEMLKFSATFSAKKENQDEILLNVIGLSHCFPLLPIHYDQQQSYINEMFQLINPFCEHYELDQIFFDFLILATNTLEKLSAYDFRAKRLHEYFEKVAMIFQIVADKTEDQKCRILFTKQARRYIEKADEVRSKFLDELPLSILYETRMSQLFQAAADDNKTAAYNRPYFQMLAIKYRNICNNISDMETMLLINSGAQTASLELPLLQKQPTFFQFQEELGLKKRCLHGHVGKIDETMPILLSCRK